MRQLILLSLTTVLLLLGQSINGQTSDSLKPEKIDIKKIAGTYNDGRFTLIIKEKNKFKTKTVAPRPLVSKGIWEIHNDTLICYLTHRNTNINNEGKKINGKPIVFKFIQTNDTIYNILNDKRVLFSPVQKTRPNIVGQFEGEEIYCRMSIKIKRNHVIKVYRKCEANKPTIIKAKWEMENDTIVVTGWFGNESQKWVLDNNCLYQINEKSKKLIARKK